MPWELARDWLLFSAAILAGGAALAPADESFSPLEAWCTGVAFAVAILAGGVFAAYAAGLGNGWLVSGYAVLAVTVALRRARLRQLWRNADVRETFLAWALVSAGCLALLACVFSYSGGTWMSDWQVHYQSTLLLLHLRPEDAEFRHFFPFTARPPLANLADAALLWATNAGYARHQVFMLLLNSLAFLPAALWARTFGGGRAAIAATALLCLLNPLFLQNATYAWTKLITALFVLTGLHLLLAGAQDRRRVITGFALLMLGVLTHYSACVWLLTFGAGWLLAARPQWRETAWRKTLALATLAGGALLALWVGFAVARYGLATTLGSNTTVTTASQYTWTENILSAGPKLWNTLVPHPLRGLDRSLLDQANPWTRFRDEVFQVYQHNLFLGAGSATLLVLAAIALKPAWRPRLPHARIWLGAGVATVVLGTAVHGHVDPWGLAHICLQPLILLALALAAARLPHLLRGEARGLAWAGAVLALADYLLGIVLHFTAMAMQLNRPPGQQLFAYADGLSAIARFNLAQKMQYGQDFFMDTTSLPWWAALGLFTSLIVLAGVRARRIARQEPATGDKLHPV